MPSFILISQSMLKKSHENSYGRTGRRTDGRTEIATALYDRFSNGRIKTEDIPWNPMKLVSGRVWNSSTILSASMHSQCVGLWHGIACQRKLVCVMVYFYGISSEVETQTHCENYIDALDHISTGREIWFGSQLSWSRDHDTTEPFALQSFCLRSTNFATEPWTNIQVRIHTLSVKLGHGWVP